MLTLKELMKRTDVARKTRARYVKITHKKTGHLSSGLGYVACKSYSTHRVNEQGKLVRTLNPDTYVTVVVFINKKLNVEVACSCLDNTFRWEWANTNKGASNIEYSNGEPPVMTNPKFKASMCKHMVALVESVRSKLPPGTL